MARALWLVWLKMTVHDCIPKLPDVGEVIMFKLSLSFLASSLVEKLENYFMIVKDFKMNYLNWC